MLSVVILIGGLAMEAKTTSKKKSSSSSKTLSVKSFIGSSSRGYNVKLNTSALTSAGYKKSGSKWVSGSGSSVTYSSNEGITEMTFRFSSSSEREKFVKSGSSLFSYDNGVYTAMSAHDCVVMEVNGNTVVLYDN